MIDRNFLPFKFLDTISLCLNIRNITIRGNNARICVRMKNIRNNTGRHSGGFRYHISLKIYFRLVADSPLYLLRNAFFIIRKTRFYSLTFTFRRRSGIFAPFSDQRGCLLPSSPRVPAPASSPSLISIPPGTLITPRDESILLCFSSISIPSEDASRLIDNNSSEHLCSREKREI